MKVIFVCTGNTCRSPMAEGYLKSKNIKDLSVCSRGFMSDGDAVSENSKRAMAECGIDISHHTSKCISPEEIQNADKIICMSPSHKNALLLYNVDDKKITVLGGGIPDPFGSDIDIYRSCRDSIFTSIDKLIDECYFNEFDVSIASSDDISSIADIEWAVFSTPWSENAIRESFNAQTTFFIAKSGGKTLGYAGLSLICGEGYITNVAVYKEFRGMGIGKMLLDEMIEFAKNNDAEFISLEVRISNAVAISLYEKMGFLCEGRRKNFYTNPNEDAIIMTRRFIDENLSN